MSEVGPQPDELLFSSVDGVSVESIEVTDTVVRVEAGTTVRRAACRGCGCWSGRIHSSYLRFPRDLPAVGKFVVRFSRATTPEELFTGQWQSRPTELDGYKPYLDQRRQEGCTDAWKLWEEIKEQGYPLGYGSVRDYVCRTLRGMPGPVGARPPSARAVTRWILTHPDALNENDRLHLKDVLVNCPEPATLAEHVRVFARMVTQLQGDRLPEWIAAATATTELPSLRRFAQHLERDLDAVIAGLSQPWNSGVVEGHVSRIILRNQRCQAVCLCITSR